MLFKAKVRETIATCKTSLYDSPHSDDPHAIRFSKWDEEKHGKALKTILTPKVGKQLLTVTNTCHMRGSFTISAIYSCMKIVKHSHYKMKMVPIPLSAKCI